jgi:hypothetical protein
MKRHLASLLLAAVFEACSSHSHPIALGAPALEGITFAVDTAPELTPQGPGPVRPLGVRVSWAGTRGRIDVLSRPVRPVMKLGDVTVGPSVAMPGDYYLFDSTGFVLVRPAKKQYSILEISDAAFNYEGRRDGWPAFFQFAPTPVDTIAAADATSEHRGEHRIYWHVDVAKDTVCTLGGCSVEELARGRTTIADAPVAELIVARWFGPAQALGQIAGGVSRLLDKPIRVTTVSPLTGIHRIRDLRALSMSRASLTVPSHFVEAPWPGLPSSPKSEGADRGAKWRTLPKSR